MPEDKFTLLVVHSLAHASMIQLYLPFLQNDDASLEKCLRAAHSLSLVTKHIADLDFDFLDPVVGVRFHPWFLF